MTGCGACEMAQSDPYCGLVYVGCPGCNVRHVSNCPGFAREAIYRTLPAEEREEFKALVTAEYLRRKALRAAA